MARQSSSGSGSVSFLRGLFARLWKRPELKAASRRTRRRMFMEQLDSRTVLASNLGAIEGLVYVDTTGNGFTIGEEVQGATVDLYLDDGDGNFEPGVGAGLDGAPIQTQVTDANGEYFFTDLGAGDYWVNQIAQVVGADTLLPAVEPVTISAAQQQGVPGTLIDSFISALPTVVAVDPVGTTDSDSAVQPPAEVIGGERDLEVELTASPGAGQNVTLSVTANKLSMNPSIQAQGRYTAVWDGADADGAVIDFTGLNNVDLTSTNASAGIVLEDVLVDQTGGSATIRVYTDATNFSTLTINIPDNAVTDLFFKFTDFTTGGGTGADFTDVGAIVLDVDSTIDAMDGEIELIQAIGYNSQIIDFDNFIESDLSLVKTVDNATPNVGDDVTFTVVVTNGGPDAAMNVAVEDLLPAGLTFVSSNPGQGAYVSGTGIWTIGTILSGATATLDVVATVASLGAKTNTAEVSASDSADLDSTPDNGVAAEDDIDSVVVTPQQVDLSVTKTVNNASVAVGSNATFTITVSNAAAMSTATNVQVTDLLPAGFTFVSSNPSQGTYVSGTGIWTVGTINTAANATLQIVATKNATGAVINAAEVTDVDQADIDSTPGNRLVAPNEDDTASATVNDLTIDLALTKTVNNATQNVGQNVTFTLTVSNTGLGNATGVAVTDLLPAGLTFVSSNPSQGAYVSGTGIWTVGAINTGANATLTITATVATTGVKTNTAEVTAAVENDIDSTPGNRATIPGEDDTATATVTPPSIDLSIDKTVNNASPNVGQNVVFTIIVSNAAAVSNATGVVVTDLLPAGLTFVSSTQTQGAYAGGTGLWTVGALNAGATATLTITATVANVGAKTNFAEVTAADQADADSTPNNRVAQPGEDDTDSVVVTPQTIDLSLTKTVNTATPNKNANVTFTITVSNAAAQSNATGVAVTDLLPAGFTFVSSTPSVGTYNSTTGVWTVGAVNTGASATLSIVATVTTIGAKINAAEVTAADQADTDSTPGNRATVPGEDDTATVTVTPAVADLSLTKTVDDATPDRNQNVVFTLTLTNGGPQTATNVTVTDLLPAGMTFVSSTPGGGTTYNSTTGVWTVASLNSGANVVLTITATTATVGAKTNTAEVTASDQFDGDSTPGNRATVPGEDDTASATVTPNATDLAVTKTVDDASPDIGQNVTFTVTVSNTSATNATNVVLTDLLPAGLTFVSSTPSQGAYVSATGIWTIGTVNANSSVTLTVVATVASNTTKVNAAEITSLDQFDSDSTPNNGGTAEDDRATVTVQPFLLSKRNCVVR